MSEIKNYYIIMKHETIHMLISISSLYNISETTHFLPLLLRIIKTD